MHFRFSNRRALRRCAVLRFAVIGSFTLAAPAAAAGGGSDAPKEEKPLTRQEQLSQQRLDCETGVADACFELALAYETRTDLWGAPLPGDGVIRDDRKAARYFRLACEHGREEGCASLAQMYRAGKGVPRNYAEAARLEKSRGTGGGQ